MWSCPRCNRYVHNREAFPFQGRHYHWGLDEQLCGPLEVVEVEDDEAHVG